MSYCMTKCVWMQHMGGHGLLHDQMRLDEAAKNHYAGLLAPDTHLGTVGSQQPLDELAVQGTGDVQIVPPSQ